MDASRVRAHQPAPVREILIAAPDVPHDLYQLHQQVWEYAHRAARPGIRPKFLFRADRGVVRVRSADFARGVERSFRPGVDASLDLAAVLQSSDGRELAVAHDDLPTWAGDKLTAAGFEVLALEVVAYDMRSGLKMDRATGRRHRITLPVASLRLRLAIADQDKALCAWREGLGRGRRFGLGMLSQ